MKILVIGSKGTLGVPLTQYLKAQGHAVYEADLQHHAGPDYMRCDIADHRQVDRAIYDSDPDMVYLLAAEFGRHNGEDHYEQCWRTNVIGTRNVLEAQRRYRFRLVFTSSSEIYGETSREWLDETLTDIGPVSQTNDYAISKWVNEQQIMNFAARHGTETVRLRLFNAYGPGERYHDYRSVVCLFGYRALHNLPYTVYKGYYRVFQYVDDLIPTMAQAAYDFRPGEVYNLGGTEYRSVEELSDMIRDLTGSTSEIQYLDEDAHNVVCKRPRIDKARADLGHDPRVKLEEGLPLTLKWLNQQYGSVSRLKIA